MSYRRGLHVLLGFFVIVAFSACARPEGAEAQVRAQLEEMAQAVEAQDPGDIQDLLAEDFSGPGGMDRARARAYASVLMARYAELGVTWTVEEMDIQRDRARTTLAVALTGKASVAGFDGRGRLMTVELGWRETDGEWLVVSAHWSNKFD